MKSNIRNINILRIPEIEIPNHHNHKEKQTTYKRGYKVIPLAKFQS
jgi:hypothetical protein